MLVDYSHLFVYWLQNNENENKNKNTKKQSLTFPMYLVVLCQKCVTSSNYEKTSDKPELRDISQNNGRVLFKRVKDVKGQAGELLLTRGG